MFKNIFNYIILLGLLYLVFINSNEKFTNSKKTKKSKKIRKSKKVEEHHTDVNSLIDSVMEEELFSKPITEEEAIEGMNHNESDAVDRYYNLHDDKEEVEEVFNNDTNVEEYIDASIQEDDDEDEEETEETKPVKKPKRDESCNAFPQIKKFRHKNSKKSSKEDNMNIYKPKSERLNKLQKVDNSMPKTIKQVFEEKIVNYKKQAKRGKKDKERIQGCFTMENNMTDKFSKFEEESESPYDMDINANDVHFENYSLI